MKSKDIFSLMINPFNSIAGWQAFGLGLTIVIVTGIIGTFSNVAFDGVIDMHLAQNLTFVHSFEFLTIDIVSLVLVMTITGFLISKGFRIIDILGTMTLAKAPYIILAIAGYFTVSPDIKEIIKNPFIVFQSVSFIILTLLTIPATIWGITLFYNAFKTSCDVKGGKLIVASIIALLISEIISKILIYNLM